MEPTTFSVRANTGRADAEARGECRSAPHRITVAVIAPGAVVIAIAEGSMNDPCQKAELEGALPRGRVGKPDETGNLAA